MELRSLTVRLPKITAQNIMDLSKINQKSVNETIVTLIQMALNDLNEPGHIELTKQSPGSQSGDSH